MKFIGGGLALVLFLAPQGSAQNAKVAYPTMAPLRQYLMPRDVENSRARSAAPKSISGDAELLILTQRAYQTAVTGTNAFVCMVARSWSADFDDPDFGIHDYVHRSVTTLSLRGLKYQPRSSGLR
jgi:hypothetical protein